MTHVIRPHDLTVGLVADRWLEQYGSAATRSAYGSDLRAFVGWCAGAGQAPLQVGPAAMARHRSERLAAGASEASVNRQHSALRAFFATADALGVATGQPFTAAPVPIRSSSATVQMSSEALGRLIAAARADARAEVLVHLLAGEGLGLSESLAIDHEDVSGEGRARRLRLVRDGSARTVNLLPATSSAIGRLQRGSTPVGPLLVARRGTNAAGRLTRFGADRLLKQIATIAGVQQPVSANVLRRTHVMTAQRAGDDLHVIRDRMGHRDVRTTRRYVASGPIPPSAPQPEPRQ